MSFYVNVLLCKKQICSFYSEVRNQVLPPSYHRRPSMFKFVMLLKTDNEHLLLKLAKLLAGVELLMMSQLLKCRL